MFDFIHIGMGKCLSTSLQNIWRRSNNYHFSSATQIKTSVEKLIQKYHAEPDVLRQYLDAIEVTVGEVARNPDQPKVLTCEGLTFSFLTSQHMADFVPVKHEILGRKLGPTARKVLIIVRSPISWITSAHAQYIREGGSLDIAAYLDQYREIILRNLDLHHIINCWSSAGSEPIILPMELYKQDPQAFWNAYQLGLDVTIPQAFEIDLESRLRNTTNYDVLATHAGLNALLARLEARFGEISFPEREGCLSGIKLLRNWGTRRALEEMSADDAQIFSSLLRLNDDGLWGRLLPHQVPDDVIDAILENYISALPETPYMSEYNMAEQYQADLLGIRH